jgi:hypothetical protein
MRKDSRPLLCIDVENERGAKLGDGASDYFSARLSRVCRRMTFRRGLKLRTPRCIDEMLLI